MKRMLIIVGIVVLVLITVEIVALLLLRSQVARYEEYWGIQAQLPRDETSLLYVALGDSAAQAIGATQPRKGYVGLIAASLSAKENQHVHVVNLSKTGATIRDAIDNQLPQLRELKPDIVTIEIGANDMRLFEAEKFKSEMDTLMKGLPKGTVISDIPYFGGGRVNHLEANARSANEIMYELVQKYDLKLAYLHEEIKQNDNLNTYAPDFFHPSNAGYKNWHNAFWEAINR
jgi:acyl-CoA thioesterase I